MMPRTERDALVAAAVADGRIAATEEQHWRTLLDRDEAGTRRVLASLAPMQLVDQAAAFAAANDRRFGRKRTA